MQEHPITLTDIRREAMLLEFDVDISTGYLDIFKRSDSSTVFSSLLPFGDPRVLSGAWQFLQDYRALLDQVDTVRHDLANRPPQRSRKTLAVLRHLLGFALAVGAGVLTARTSGNVLLALLAFIVVYAVANPLFAVMSLLRPRQSDEEENVHAGQ